MSLINDALKRTQQTTQGDVPPRLDALDLRPIELGQPPVPPGIRWAKWILWVVAMLVVAGNVVLWIAFRNYGSRIEAAARTAKAEAVASPAPQPEPDPAVSDPAPTVEVSPANGTGIDAAGLGAPTFPGPEPAVIQRPELKLKTIVSHPVRPSAMINNQVVFLGDRVEGYIVTAIGQSDVTLESGDDEVVLSLP